METKIRLARFGGKKRPYYRVVVASIATARNGRFIDVVGSYDPVQGIQKAKLDRQKIDQWIQKGAKPTEVVRSMLRAAPKAA